MKVKWELAYYLIKAKKDVDSILFISKNIEQLKYIGLKDRVDSIRSDFFINCCIVLDNSVCNSKTMKKELCRREPIIERIYYERDKNCAHKDECYKSKEYSSIQEIADEMQSMITNVMTVCLEYLPNILTLDFVAHDKELFRLIYQTTAEVEKHIMKSKYAQGKYDSDEKGRSFKILHDIDEWRSISEDERPNYCVMFKDGLCLNEGLQERQDSCILFNLLFNKNIWCSANKNVRDKVDRLTELGCFDEYGRIMPPLEDLFLLEEAMEVLIDD